MPLAQATPIMGELAIPVLSSQQPTAVAQVSPVPGSPATPSPEIGRSSTPSAPEGQLPPPAPGYPARLPPSPLLSPDIPEMDLERLVQIALDNQPRLRSSQASLEGAQARVGIAKSAYFPTIDTTLGYNRATANVAGGISPSSGNVIQRRVSGTSVNRQDFTAELTQNVFDSFRREWRLQAAREEQNAAQFDLSTTRQDVILSVQEAFYNYLLARRLVEVNAEAVRRNLQNLERARGFFEVGTRPKIDVTRAQVDLANAELGLVRARNAVAVTFAALNNAIGVPEFPPYRVSADLEIAPMSEKPEELMKTLEDSIRTALENRTEIRAFQARIRAAEAALTLSKRNFLPSVSAGAEWNYRGQELPYAPNWTVGATLSVPILNPPLFSQVDEAASDLAGAQANEEISAQNVVLEVQQSFVDLVSARERIRTAEVLLAQARENLALAQGRYEVGVGPLIDVTDAELALTQAESENIQAIVDYKLSEVRLRKAMGLVE
ncbi:MAG: TolC family protein [Candidatus Tectomicrobia bacterium]|nr:TolC family protein [Candidatus Tectomicrobia bacterium]